MVDEGDMSRYAKSAKKEIEMKAAWSMNFASSGFIYKVKERIFDAKRRRTVVYVYINIDLHLAELRNDRSHKGFMHKISYKMNKKHM